MLKVCGDPDKRRADGRFALRQPSGADDQHRVIGVKVHQIVKALFTDGPVRLRDQRSDFFIHADPPFLHACSGRMPSLTRTSKR